MNAASIVRRKKSNQDAEKTKSVSLEGDNIMTVEATVVLIGWCVFKVKRRWGEIQSMQRTNVTRDDCA